MDSQKQKQKKSHVVIVTSNAEDANVKRFQIRSWVVWLILIVVCVLLGAVLGYFMFEDQIWNNANGRIEEYKQTIKEMQMQINTNSAQTLEEKKQLEEEIEKIQKDNSILKDTVNLIREEKDLLKGQVERLYNPTMLPLTGGATIEENTEGDPLCLFYASEGELVVASAAGTVTEIIEEPEYGYKVSVDHGNGYVTIYRNKGVPKVKPGERLMQGVTIFVIGSENVKLGYQILKDGGYIHPMEIMEIEG